MSDSANKNRQDHLRINSYYKGLAKYIQEAETPLSISIQGEWGSGKTFALKEIEKNLELRGEKKSLLEMNDKKNSLSEEDKEALIDAVVCAGFCDKKNSEQNCHVIWFNTWQYSCLGVDDNLILALFSHLKSELAELKLYSFGGIRRIILKRLNSISPVWAAKKISKWVESKRRWRKRLRGFVWLLKPLTFLLGLIFSGSGGLFEVASHLVDKMEKSDNVQQLTEAIRSLKSVIQNLINTIVPKGKRLVIFVDDLDRLDPKVAVELLSGIKNLLDCKKCIFVLAIDEKVVMTGVKEKYGAFYDDERANQFFDKLIKVPFSMPTQMYDIHYFLEEEYLAKELSEERTEDYVRVVQKLFQNNPRSIKRAFRSWKLHKCIFEELEEKYFYNLFVILAYQLAADDSYSKLVELAKNNELDKLSNILFGKDENEKLSIAEYLDKPSCPFEDIKRNVAESETEGEREWKTLLSMITRVSDVPLSSKVSQLEFSDEVKTLIEEIRKSEKYEAECYGDSLCEFFDLRENRAKVARFFKNADGKERLSVYRIQPEENYKDAGGFVQYCKKHLQGLHIGQGNEHVTISLDMMPEQKKINILKKFLNETMKIEMKDEGAVD